MARDEIDSFADIPALVGMKRDKVTLARRVAPLLTWNELSEGLRAEVCQVVERIRAWNADA